MTELSHLPPRERAKRYREFARSARMSATTTGGELRDSYIKLAGQWSQLALEADADAEDEPGN
jgi:hypothetical protein